MQTVVAALEAELESERQAVVSPETKALRCKMAGLEAVLNPSSAPDAAPAVPLHAVRGNVPLPECSACPRQHPCAAWPGLRPYRTR